MTRVTSQKTRQAVLVTGDPLDPATLPEKIQLFNEIGEPLMLGGGFARREQEETTDVLDPNETENSTLEFYPSVRLYKIATNVPARVRLYPTPEMLLADAPRPIGVKPVGNHGRLLEVVTVAGLTELILTPAVDITSVDAFDAEFYVAVTSLAPTPVSVAVTYHYFRTE